MRAEGRLHVFSTRKETCEIKRVLSAGASVSRSIALSLKQTRSPGIIDVVVTVVSARCRGVTVPKSLCFPALQRGLPPDLHVYAQEVARDDHCKLPSSV